jgi:hypothetical protein
MSVHSHPVVYSTCQVVQGWQSLPWAMQPVFLNGGMCTAIAALNSGARTSPHNDSHATHWLPQCTQTNQRLQASTQPASKPAGSLQYTLTAAH